MAMQLTTGERLGVTQKYTADGGKALVGDCFASVDESEDHDWVVGQFARVVIGARVALKAQCG